MKSEFSEFSYGYSVVDELINWYGSALVSAPDFPTTVAEARKGYDVRLQMPSFALFLQFKASDCMVRATADETRRGDFSPPFYRMHLRRINRSRQHELLLQLENQEHFVFYVAPAFHRAEELNRAYFSRKVAVDSIWIRPSEIGPLPDNNYHHVSFQLPRTFIRYSEPQHLQGHYTFEDLTKHLSERLQAPGTYLLTEQVVSDLETSVTNLINEYITGPRRWEQINRENFPEDIHPLFRISYLARTFFDTEFLVCRAKQKERIESSS